MTSCVSNDQLAAWLYREAAGLLIDHPKQLRTKNITLPTVELASLSAETVTLLSSASSAFVVAGGIDILHEAEKLHFLALYIGAIVLTNAARGLREAVSSNANFPVGSSFGANV